MFKNIRIGTKILIIILSTSLSALLCISIISYIEMLELTQYSQNSSIKLGMTSASESQKALLDQAKDSLLKLALEQAENIDSTFLRVQEELLIARDYTESLYAKSENFQGRDLPLPDETEKSVLSSKYMLAPGVNMTPDLKEEIKLISNLEYVLDPTIRSNSIFFNVYLGTKDGISYRHSTSNSYNKDYDVRKRDWFTSAMSKNRDIVWLDTYYDPFGYTVLSAAAAYQDGANNLRGVIATDLILDKVEQKIINTKMGESGFAFIIDSKGKYIVHPKYQEENFNTNAFATKDETWQNVFQAMAKGEIGIATVGGDMPYYVAYAPLNTTGWALGITIAIHEITKPAEEIESFILNSTHVTQEFIHNNLSNILLGFILLFALCAMALVFLSFILSKYIIRDIQRIINGTEVISNGNYDVEIKTSSADELGDLAESLNVMAKNIKRHNTM